MKDKDFEKELYVRIDALEGLKCESVKEMTEFLALINYTPLKDLVTEIYVTINYE
jgi:hypothetical protein